MEGKFLNRPYKHGTYVLVIALGGVWCAILDGCRVLQISGQLTGTLYYWEIAMWLLAMVAFWLPQLIWIPAEQETDEKPKEPSAVKRERKWGRAYLTVQIVLSLLYTAFAVYQIVTGCVYPFSL